MRELWRRLTDSRWLNPGLWLISTVLTLFSVRWAWAVLAAGPDALGTAADRGQIVGIPLTALGVALSLLTFRRSRRSATEAPPPRELLARQVNARESAVRSALLGGVAAADLGFTGGAAEPQAAPGRRRGERRGERHEGRRSRTADAGGAAASRVRLTVARLLSWREPPLGEGGRRGREGTPEGGGRGDGSDGGMADIVGYFSGLPEHRLVVVGDRGSGKTVLVIELVIGLTRAIIDDPVAHAGPVPVRLSAASWTGARPFDDWLAGQLAATYALTRSDAEVLVRERLVMPVLDGLDEMDPDPADPVDPAGPAGPVSPGLPGGASAEEEAPRATALLRELNRYYAGTAFAPVVVTTRPGRDRQLRGRGLLLDHARRIVIRPLDIPRIDAYLSDRHRDRPVQREAWRPVLDRLGEAAHAGVLRFLATPWRLMLAVVAVESDPGRAAHLAARADHGVPESPGETYRRLEEVLMGGFVEAATALAPRSRALWPSAYSPRQVERWLTTLARHLRRQAGQAPTPAAPENMSGVDLVPHLLWPIGGRALPRVLHTVAAVVTAFAGMVLVVPVGRWADNLRGWVWEAGRGQWGRPAGHALVLAFLAYVAVILVFTVGRRWPAPGAATGRRVPIRARVPQIAVGLVFGVPVGASFGVAVWTVAGLDAGVLAGFASGLTAGGLAGCAKGRFSWEPVADLPSPHRAVHDDLVFGLVAGLGAGVLAGLASWLQNSYIARPVTWPGNGPALWAGAGVAIGLAAWLGAGAGGARYMIGVTLAALRGRLPWRFAAFCRWACDAGLLRVAGAGYQFRHGELQSRLIARHPAPASAAPGRAPSPGGVSSCPADVTGRSGRATEPPSRCVPAAPAAAPGASGGDLRPGRGSRSRFGSM